MNIFDYDELDTSRFPCAVDSRRIPQLLGQRFYSRLEKERIYQLRTMRWSRLMPMTHSISMATTKRKFKGTFRVRRDSREI